MKYSTTITDQIFSGSLGLWWSNNCRSKSSPLPLRGLPSRSRFSASPDWSQKPLVLPDPPTRLPSPQAGAQLPAPRLASCAPRPSSPTWGRTSPASWTGRQKNNRASRSERWPRCWPTCCWRASPCSCSDLLTSHLSNVTFNLVQQPKQGLWASDKCALLHPDSGQVEPS